MPPSVVDTGACIPGQCLHKTGEQTWVKAVVPVNGVMWVACRGFEGATSCFIFAACDLDTLDEELDLHMDMIVTTGLYSLRFLRPGKEICDAW